jgi:hypothetical protein
MSALRGVLTADQRDQLRCLTRDRSVDAVLALRARLVLWWDEDHSAVQIAEWAGVAERLPGYGLCGTRSLVSRAYAAYHIRGGRGRTTSGFELASLP